MLYKGQQYLNEDTFKSGALDAEVLDMVEVVEESLPLQQLDGSSSNKNKHAARCLPDGQKQLENISTERNGQNGIVSFSGEIKQSDRIRLLDYLLSDKLVDIEHLTDTVIEQEYKYPVVYIDEEYNQLNCRSFPHKGNQRRRISLLGLIQ